MEKLFEKRKIYNVKIKDKKVGARNYYICWEENGVKNSEKK